MPVPDTVGPGLALGLDAAYGVSRSVFVGLWGQYGRFASGSECDDCESTSYAVGPFVRYHLVQGVRFDPWVLAGLGYRVTELGPDQVRYSGIDWVRFSVGGDWYGFSNLALGALLELSMGVYNDRSEGELGGATPHWQFASGLRVVFDAPGK